MAEYEVLWTDLARTDLDDMANCIVEEDGVDTALDVVNRLDVQAENLYCMPQRRVIVPERELFIVGK